MGTKTDQNKQQKKEMLLNTAFHLFTTKGINKTSISEPMVNFDVDERSFL